ncbi:MAG: serine/threonine-protein kinase PknK, partial [Cyanobacteriota bacterium]|nr:serine/threonine-protein kinase PknK [Cyanobacteriota bacterium]
MTIIPGYQSFAQIYESANSLIYRAIRERDNKAVILKVLKEDYPTPQELTRYKQEYEITRHLNLDGAIKAFALEPYQRTLVIIFEDFGASSLKLLMDERMKAGTRAMPLQEFLRLAIQITQSLGTIHAASVIHKDINPSNIVLNPETEQLKIIDFGISTVLTRSNPNLSHPNVLEGTLAYISPEQTGRMNRYLDYRTDFYSLGVTFYELLTGKVPFATTDVLELVHCQIAKQPKSPREVNSEIPQVLSDIIMKLMAKTAEERYQSAWGIIADLEECKRQLEVTGTVEDFPIGSQDISDKFQIPQKLYGREAEVETLMTAFERVAGGDKGARVAENSPKSPVSSPQSRIEMMLVTGYSGIGKSALVQEIYKPITQRRGYLISGKFDQFQRNIPYLAVVSAFTGLVRQVLTESEAQLNQWREKLLAALGSNAQVIIDVIPEVELIVGKQAAVPELGATEAQNRFNLVFQNFIRVFCSYEHPLVIFLDDLQWVCPATLKLIELMLTDTDMQYLFLIGAYRDNEVNPTHPLMMTLEGLRKQGATINQIILAPLALNHITHLIAETLHSDTESVKLLAELVGRKTGGNPFFVNEFLKTLYTENLLTFIPPGEIGRWRDREIITPLPNWGWWQWDIAQIEAQNITDNVVELMIGKLKKLSKSTQHILRLAACVGAYFDLNTLSIICEKSSAEIFYDLLVAVQIGLILPTSELDTQLLIQDYKFGHDRIQQAAYTLIDEAQKKAVHLQIGRLLLQNIVPEALSEKLFEIVDHLNVGWELITHQAERDEIAKLNLMAGQKALTATAYEAALKYFNAGRQLLSADSWQNSYDLTLALYEAVAEAAYLTGNLEQMEQSVEVALNRAKTVLDQVKVYEVKIQAAWAQGNLKKAIEIGLQVLKLLGVILPEEPSQLDIQRGLEETASLLAGQEIEDLINLPEMTEPEKLAVLSILSITTACAYTAAPALVPLLVCEQVNLSIKYGNTALSTFTYVLYAGGILCGIVQDIESGYKFGKLALDLMERLNAKKLKPQLFEVFGGAVVVWKAHLRESIPILIGGYQSGVEIGDFAYAGYSALYACEHSYLSGQELTGLEQKIATFNKSIHQLKQETPFNWTAILWQVVLNLLDRAENPMRLIGDAYNEERSLPRAIAANDRTGLHRFYLNKLILCYLFGEEHQAVKNSILAEQYLDGTLGLVIVALFHFYDSLVHLDRFIEASNSEKEVYLNRVNINQEKMQKWAHHAPMNYLHKFYLVEAEKARVLGQIAEAMDFYEQAIKGAKENSFIQEEALAYELAAKFYLARGMEKIAQTYMKEAHYTYTHWGATAKVKDLELRYPQFFAKRSPNSSKTTQTILDTSEETSTDLDLLSIVKASQTLSGELMLDTLL